MKIVRPTSAIAFVGAAHARQAGDGRNPLRIADCGIRNLQSASLATILRNRSYGFFNEGTHNS
jgi:hypothetical protein